MARGKKTQRQMNRLIRTIKRNRIVKKASRRSWARPEGDIAAAEAAPETAPAAETAAPAEETAATE